MNSGVLKILHALSAHSSRKKPAAISTSQCRSHNFAPKTGDKLFGRGLKPGASSSLRSLSSSGLSSASLSCHHTEQSTFWKHLRWNRRAPILSSLAKHQLSCDLSSGPLASPEVHSAEGRGDKVKLGTAVRVLPCSLYRSTEINQKQKYSLGLFHRVTSVSKTHAEHAKYVFSRIYFCLRFLCFLN